MNVRSITNNFEQFVLSDDYDILGISETWLLGHTDDQF